MEPNELELAVAKALEAFDVRQSEKAAKAAEKEALEKVAYERGLAEGEKKAKTWIEEKAAPVHMKVAKPGSGGKSGDMEAFAYWMRSGDEVAAKRSLEQVGDGEVGQGVDEESRKAMSSATGAAGEYLVPDDIDSTIIEKRDAISFPRKMGVRVFQTDLKVVDLPAESTALTKFSRTAELGTYSTNDPVFAQNQVTVQKWTKVTRFSEEILDDNVAGLLDYYGRGLARAMAATEAYYVAVGNGTNQHSGIFESGDTDAFTYNTDTGMDSDLTPLMTVSGAALWRHYFDLPQGYRADAAWLMASATLADILSVRTTKGMEWGSADLLTIDPRLGEVNLLGKPVFTQDDLTTNTNNVGFIAIGSPFYYTLVERKGISIARNPFLYQGSGEIAFFTSFRQSGTVTVEEAWNIGVGATVA